MKDDIFPSHILDADQLRFKREIRDPIYNYIHVTKLESELIDTPEFQRLNRLYQTPVVRYIYPSATHTRKAHSLGAMYLYHKALVRLLYHQNANFSRYLHPLYSVPTLAIEGKFLDNLDQPLGNKWWDSKSLVEILQTGRLIALLHDLGHGPFSHLFEIACNDLSKYDHSFSFNHEIMSANIIENNLSKQLNDIITTEEITAILRKEKQIQNPGFVTEIIDGPYDVDKLDYINRDTYHCGTKEYGTVDYERIIDGFRVAGQKLLISKSAVGALMSEFNSLQLGYINIYYHKTCRIFDHMILDALRIIPEYVKEIALDLNKLLDTDDITFLREIKHKIRPNEEGSRYEKSWTIIKDVLNRKKRYSQVYQHHLTVGLIFKLEDQLSELKIKFEEKYKEVGLVMDFTDKIRGLRIESS